MAEKKENKSNFDIKDLNQYFDLIKKYCLKILKLDPQTYFFIVPVMTNLSMRFSISLLGQ